MLRGCRQASVPAVEHLIGLLAKDSPYSFVPRDVRLMEATMMPAKAAQTSGAADAIGGSCKRPRIEPRWLLSSVCLFVAGLLLNHPMPAAAQEKRIEIGVLALGPRPVPAWHCGP